MKCYKVKSTQGQIAPKYFSWLKKCVFPELFCTILLRTFHTNYKETKNNSKKPNYQKMFPKQINKKNISLVISNTKQNLCYQYCSQQKFPLPKFSWFEKSIPKWNKIGRNKFTTFFFWYLATWKLREFSSAKLSSWYK